LSALLTFNAKMYYGREKFPPKKAGKSSTYIQETAMG